MTFSDFLSDQNLAVFLKASEGQMLQIMDVRVSCNVSKLKKESFLTLNKSHSNANIFVLLPGALATLPIGC